MRRIVGRRRAFVLLAAAALVVGATGIALAQSTDGVINACVKNANGQPRFVAAPDACKKAEHLVSWNQAGQPGLPGPKGDTGPAAELDPYTRTASFGSNNVMPTAFAASCDSGDELLNGGYQIYPFNAVPEGGWEGKPDFADVMGAMPAHVTTEDRWEFQVTARTLTGEPFALTVRAFCVP